MKVFYDTEFLEDGRTIDLISIGMVDEQGREFYAVNEEVKTDQALYLRITKHKWLMENVIPHLPLRSFREGERMHQYSPPGSTGSSFFQLDMNSNLVMPRRMIRNGVRDFLAACDPVELWAWYGAYDHVALAQLWGPMIQLPRHVPMWTNDLRQEVQRLGNPELPLQESNQHNALDDARWVRDSWSYLRSLAR